MSMGSKVVPIRFPEELLKMVLATIAKRNETTKKEPWDFSKFVREACENQISKMGRSRKSKKPKSEQERREKDS